jgi:hypothetical protein
MTTVAEITGAVRKLPKRELARFREWFAEWDAEFGRDVADGRLDKLAKEALREHRNGRTMDL